MSTPWLTPKPNEQQSDIRSMKDTSGVSILHNSEAIQRNSADKPEVARRVPPSSFTTPHDAILANLQGTQKLADNEHGVSSMKDEPAILMDKESMLTRDELLRSRSDLNLLSVTPTPSLQPSRGGGPQEALTDPFDGNILGVLIQDDASRAEGQSHSQLNLFEAIDSTIPPHHHAAGEDVWSHLSRIVDLQTQISKLHIGMEGIGASKASDPKKPTRFTHQGATPMTATIVEEPVYPLFPPGIHPRKRSASGATIESTGDGQDGEDAGVGNDSEEMEQNRAREQEFAKLARQFEGRKEAIQDIMSKLDDLSKALSEFHTLQTPQVDIPGSRQNSLAFNSPPSTVSPFGGVDSEPKKSSQPPPSAANRTYDWAHQAPSSSAQTSSVPLTRSKSDNVNFKGKKIIPTLMINNVEPGARLIDSPVSSLGSVKLPPEE